MKKIKTLALLLVSCMLALFAGVFIGCSPSEPKQDNLTALEHSTISAVGIFNANSNSVQTVSLEAGGVSELTNLTLSSFQDVVKKNLAIAYTTSNDKVVRGEVTASDKEGYAFKYTVTVTGADGAEKAYTFHYNTTLQSADGSESFGEGIVEINGIEFFVKSEYEIENGEKEYKFTIKKSDNAYIVVEQEIENGESSLSYVAYINGNKVFETETEYEIKNGKIEVGYSIEVAGVEIDYSYNFITENDVIYAKVEIEIDKDNKEKNLSFKFRIDFSLDGAMDFVLVQ